jgi:hypothetical protein
MTSVSPRCCVVSLATKDKRYSEGLKRLEKSLERAGFSGDVVCWRPGTYPAGCPSHLDVPFAFKPFCFMAAKRRYDLVLWLDARCVVIRKLDPVFAEIEERGYVLFRNRRFVLGEWASDLALDLFGLSREQALGLPEVNAAALGLDLRNPVAASFLDSWYEAARDGRAFRGTVEPLRSWEDYQDVKRNRSGKVSTDPRVRGHRHDQTVAGILAHRLDLNLYDGWLQVYSRTERHIARSSRILINRQRASFERIAKDKLLGSLAQLAGKLLGSRPRD